MMDECIRHIFIDIALTGGIGILTALRMFKDILMVTVQTKLNNHEN